MVGALFGCTDNFKEFNTDSKSPSQVPAGTLFANSTVALFDFMTTPNVNQNNLRLWAQQWAQTTYPDESNYELIQRDVNKRTWDTFYATVIKDANEAKKIIADDAFLSAEDKTASTALTDVIEVFAYHILVDIFGDIPYSEALSIENLTPKYDKAADIYQSLISRLDGAITNLNGSSGLGSYDLVYNGDLTKWRKFANSLKLRLAIRMADSNDAMAKSMAEEAVADGVFTSIDDDFQLAYESSTPNTNPLWVSLVQSGRSDFVCANTIADYMNELEDPRRQLYFSEPFDSATGGLIGGIYGDSNSPTPFSHAGANQVDPTFPGTILDFSEVNFLLADAAERGYNVGGSAEDFYNAGIEASILEWGGNADHVAAYLENEKVAYSTADGNWKQKIAMQKWLALYNRGFEAWTTYRMYDSPEMNVAVGAGTTPPMRYSYPVTEFSLNKTNVEAAIDAIGGTDDTFKKIFWDVN